MEILLLGNELQTELNKYGEMLLIKVKAVQDCSRLYELFCPLPFYRLINSHFIQMALQPSSLSMKDMTKCKHTNTSVKYSWHQVMLSHFFSWHVLKELREKTLKASIKWEIWLWQKGVMRTTLFGFFRYTLHGFILHSGHYH